MNDHEAKKFVESIYRDIWAAKDLNKLPEYYHPELKAIIYQPDGIELEMNFDTLKQFAHKMAHERHEVETIIESVMAQDDRIVFHFKQRSVMNEDARVFYVRTAGEYILENGKIKNVYAISNRIWGP